MRKVSRLSNLLARSFIVFLIAYLWLSFYIRDIVFVFLLSVSISFVFNLIIHFLTRTKRNRQKRFNHILKIVKKHITFREYMAGLKIIVFNRRRIRGYIFTGIVIFLSSFIVRFNIYYIVISTVLFSLALITTIMVQFEHVSKVAASVND